ncbi:Set1 complex component swd1 [Peziza echinospora]|nr:Set1 complex component swd1 [Peziza echinospora]
MNLSLLDPFALAQEYPENLKYTLKSGHSTCIRFNWKGDILASGRLDGVVVLFDMDTRSLARVLRGHVRQIQSLSWSTSGRYLLSASQDWKAVLWDLEVGQRIRSVRFDSPIYIAEIHPLNHLIFVASLYEDTPYLVDMTNPSGKSTKIPLPTAPLRPLANDAEEGEIDEKRAVQDAKQLTTATVFTSNGRYIIAGTNKGWVNIISAEDDAEEEGEEGEEREIDNALPIGSDEQDDGEAEEGEEKEERGTAAGYLRSRQTRKSRRRRRRKGEVLGSTRLTNGCITYIRLTASGKDMVVNANDRILRTLQVPGVLCSDSAVSEGASSSLATSPRHGGNNHDRAYRHQTNSTNTNITSTTTHHHMPIPTPSDLHLEVEHKFQDVVNRLLWNHCAFSSTGEYMTASTYKNHDIYIWERNVGSLVKILEGPKEELGVVEWHPSKPLVAAVGLETGEVYVWANEVTQQWSALAPDFVEVEENVEYVEREDEFDVHPKEEVKRRKMQIEDEVVDVFGVGEDGGGNGGGRGGDDGSLGGGRSNVRHSESRRGREEWRMPVVLGLEDTDDEDAAGGSPSRRRSPAAQESGGGGGGGGGNTSGRGGGGGGGAGERVASRRAAASGTTTATTTVTSTAAKKRRVES